VGRFIGKFHCQNIVRPSRVEHNYLAIYLLKFSGISSKHFYTSLIQYPTARYGRKKIQLRTISKKNLKIIYHPVLNFRVERGAQYIHMRW
jgi:hypothetical protein